MILDASNIEWSEFVQSSLIAKAMAVMKAPVYTVLTVTIPVVDTDLPLQGWHRGLALSQCLISPHVCLILTGSELTHSFYSSADVQVGRLLNCIVPPCK